MFDKSKFEEVFDPDKFKGSVHLIGCGAVGSCVGEILARLGLKEVHLWDADKIAPHNIGNQQFYPDEVDLYKNACLGKHMHRINPDIKIKLHENYEGEPISGYVFVCVDNIETRKHFYELWQHRSLKFVTDLRMAVTDFEIDTADWMYPNQRKYLLDTASTFTQEEAKNEILVSACGMEQSIIYNPMMLSCMAVSNFVNFVNKGNWKPFIAMNVKECGLCT